MAMAHHQLQQQHHQPPDTSFRNLYGIDGQISPALAYCNPTNVPDHTHHPPYVPPFHVVGFAPNPVPGADAVDGGGDDLQWNCYNLEPKKKNLKEQDFLENNSQISSVDFLQVRPVSTGLGLSLDNHGGLSSTGESPLFALLGDDIDRELRQQDTEIDRYLKIQGERLRQAVLSKVQTAQLQTISLVEEKVLQKLREKELELEKINRKNAELQERIKQLSQEANAWQQQAKYNENIIAALRYNLQQVYVQTRDSKEGCGDSEVDDTASCCDGRAVDFQLLCKENIDKKELMTCRFCRVNEACMLLLPCKHLCLCKDCESKLSCCPLCQASKFNGVEIYM